MFKPASRAGTPIITPPLRSEDATVEVAQANAEALNSAAMTAGRYNGIVQLPVGNIYFDTTVSAAATLDERHAGIVIRGAGPGKTVLIPVSAKGFNFISRLVDGRSLGNITAPTTVTVPNGGDYEVEEVIYFWNVQSGPDRSPRLRVKITARDQATGIVTHDGSSTGFSDFMHVKGFIVDGPAGAGQPVPVGATSVRLPVLANVGFFAPGDDVLLGDGPGINQFLGEWLTVADVNATTGDVTFTTPTVQSYEANKAALVPGYQPFPGGGRQHMSDITLQDLSIAAPEPGEVAVPAIGLVRAGLRIAFDNVGFRTHPATQPPTTFSDLQFVTCGRTSVRDANVNARLVVGTSQNASFDNVTAAAVHLHEYARDCVFTACRTTGPGGFTIGPLECRHIDLTNCTLSGYASNSGVANVAFASNSAITGVQLRRPLNADDPVVLTGQNIRVTTLASDSPVTLAAGSSGELLTPLDPGKVGDASGDWDQPLTVRSNGVVRVPTFAIQSSYGPDLVVQAGASTKVALQVRGRTGQSEDLQQWQDASGATLLAVRLDGYLETSKTEDAGDVTSTILKKLKVYLPDGSIYYLALYNDL